MKNFNADRMQLVKRWYAEGFYGEQTIADTINQAAVSSPNAFLVLESDERLGRVVLADAVRKANDYAQIMRSLGIKPGDVVAVQLPNWIETAIICQAVWLAGAVLLPITAVSSANDLLYILNDGQANMLFIPAQWKNRQYSDDANKLREQSHVSTVVVVDDDEAPVGCLSWRDFTTRTINHSALSEIAVHADDTALLIYTSGTTSRPKGVLHTHNSLIYEARKGQINWGEQRYATQLSPWPHGHIASTITMMRWWIDGINIVLADKWQPELIASLVERYQVGATSGVPYFLSSMVEAAQAKGIDISSLKNYATGATNVPAQLMEVCNRQGIFAYRMYGSTEHPTATSGVPGDALEKCILSDGKALPGSEVRIVDEHGIDVEVGSDGELALRGPDQFAGYLNAVDNAGAFLAGGWFLTGDIGKIDAEGYVTITDRKKDIIIRGGENISSREVEEAVNLLPEVIESAAVAMPDKRLGEKVCCYIVLQKNAELSLERIAKHFHGLKIARFKTPERIVLIDVLPRNATGKIQKHRLRSAIIKQ